MANVWKIGSRWSEQGSWESRIISVFRRSGVVFLGQETERFKNEVKKGDYFAIADGYTIPAVARAVSDPIPLNELIDKRIIRVRADEPFDLNEDYSGCYGVKVKIVDLPVSSVSSPLYYEKRGTFFLANSISKKVIQLFNDGLETKFDIQARTYRIKSTRNQNDGKDSIIDDHTIYNIPVYQREYSWKREQVSRFITDIMRGFWGAEEVKEIRREPIFIGTMQLSYKKFISQNENEQDVIDGQQRLSTILCLLQYLKFQYNDSLSKKGVHTTWLETRVNNGKEDAYLNEVLHSTSLEEVRELDDFELNRYAKNLIYIQETISELSTDENDNEIALFKEHVDDFIEYILNDIYFVVVETVAGLSKTIQIFNTINTAGLDLNGNDLFKVRLYEYLHDIKNLGEETFNEIGDIYKNVKDRNAEWRKTHNFDVVSIGRIRSAYKYYLISKYKLPTSLYTKATDTFFDELFDVLLNVQGHPEMKNLRGLELSLDDLRKIVNAVCFWNTSEFRNEEDFINYTLIERSRYSRYTNVAYQILIANEGKLPDELLNEVYNVMYLLSRMFFCYSIRYAKAVNEVHSFMHTIYRLCYNYVENKTKIEKEIINKIRAFNNKDFRKNCIGRSIADNRTWKDLICVLDAFLYEKEAGTPLDRLQNYFDGGYDIEHIHANANEEEATDIPYELQNGIGNLMVLEEDINRSIGCLPFNEKKNRSDGGKCYQNSIYAVVKNIMKEDCWTLDKVKERLEKETNRISNYLFVESFRHD